MYLISRSTNILIFGCFTDLPITTLVDRNGVMNTFYIK